MTAIRELILEAVRHPAYRPVKSRNLLRRLIVPDADVEDYERVLEELQRARLIRIGRDGRIRPSTTGDSFETVVRRQGSGAGTCLVRNEPHEGDLDVWIAPEDMLTANSGDRVLVQLTRRRRRNGQRCGRVVEVLGRNTTRYVGTFRMQADRPQVVVDGKNFDQPFKVDDADGWQVQPGDKVQIEILRFPRHGESGDAVLVEVLDHHDPAYIDALSVISEFGLPDAFPDDVLAEARERVAEFDESNLDGRLDLREECVVTIDPASAADFDDAISLKRSDDGHWHLGVHIADVSHFVREGSRLDVEAYQRGTSVYLPQRVLPMLPRVISNGLASLQQGKVRFAKSVFIEFTADGIPVGSRFENSAIRVTKRLAYEMVMPIVREPSRFRGRVSAPVRSLLHQMYELSRILRKRRMKAGALNLVLPEVELEYDKSGAVVGAHERPHDESHEIIEEFMLAANLAVAAEFNDRGITFLRRVHAPPSLKRMKEFALFCAALGMHLQRVQDRREILDLLREVESTELVSGIHFAFLKSLKQAEYSIEEMGHYALAVDDYCHFTSPIRRYPDLLVHRQLQQLITRRGKRKPTASTWEQGRQCSLLERRAERAERELVKIKLLRVMQPRVGEDWLTTITGVEKFGVFCRGVDLPAEGLLPVESLGNEQFDYDQTQVALVGRRSGRILRLGERLQVVIESVDIDRREMRLRLGDQPFRGRSHQDNARTSPRRKSSDSDADTWRRKGLQSGKPRRGKGKRGRKRK